jgi:alpha-ketoglutarate-dependent 2,4-dichlorophenoxyacetate dioxygenase
LNLNEIFTMPLQIKPLHPLFAAEASGLDLTKALNADEIRQINDAMNQYAVLVWKNQPLTMQEQLQFSQSFGPLDIGLKRIFKRPERLVDERLVDISNVEMSGQVAPRDSRKNLSSFANQLWHSDSSFMNPRAAYSILHSVIKPSWGGNTEFSDLRAAYDALTPEMKIELSTLKAEHFALHTRILLGDDAYTDDQKKEIPPAIWPLVDTHPGSGRKVLFVGVHAREVIGWPTAEGRIFLSDLLEHATQRQFVYTHNWDVGDTVMWDNRSTVHRGRRFDIMERRELRRTTINDEPDAIVH